jgi:hypothetical protein
MGAVYYGWLFFDRQNKTSGPKPGECRGNPEFKMVAVAPDYANVQPDDFYRLI